MKKRFLSILLAAALICALLAVPAAADYKSTRPFFEIDYLDSRRTDRISLDQSASSDGWSYDADSATFTMDGLEAQMLHFFDSDRFVTIVLADGSENTINSFWLMDCHDSVIITGNGTLNLTAGPEVQGGGWKGDFINDLEYADPPLKTTVKSGTININSFLQVNGELEIAGGTVTCRGGMFSNGQICTVTGGTLILDTDESAIRYSDYKGESPTGLEDAAIVGADGQPLSIGWADGFKRLYDAAGNVAAYAKITAAGAPAEDPAPAADGDGEAYEESENYFDVLYVNTDDDRIRVHYDAVASGEGWSYDGDSATLTLNGVSDAVFDLHDAGRVVTILLADGSVNDLVHLRFWDCHEDVIITGSGTLNLSRKPDRIFDMQGFFNNHSRAKVIVKSGVINIDGMIMLYGDLVIEGGTVTGKSVMVGNFGGDCTVTGGTLILDTEDVAVQIVPAPEGERRSDLEDATIVGAEGEPLSMVWVDEMGVLELRDAAGNTATYAKITAGSAPAPAPSAGIFADVPGDAYYADAVSWAYNHEPQITTGTSETEFSPAGHVTRAQAVTFLWRVKGCPEPESPVSDFSDVQDPGSWYYKAVLWAVEQGITNGTGNGQFSPDKGVTRGQMITFLYRAMGEPGKTGAGEWYADAENWARQNGLLDGTAAAYETSGDCPRSDVVYYLWKQLAD